MYGSLLPQLILYQTLISSTVGQIQSATGPGVKGLGPAQPVDPSRPNLPTGQPHSPPLPQANRGFSLQPIPNAPELSPRSQPGVQWSSTVRPRPPGTPPSSPTQVSAIDLKWGVLFDQNGAPTKRWEQVLGGIGSYLVSSCLDNQAKGNNHLVTRWCRWTSSCHKRRW